MAKHEWLYSYQADKKQVKLLLSTFAAKRPRFWRRLKCVFGQHQPRTKMDRYWGYCEVCYKDVSDD